MDATNRQLTTIQLGDTPDAWTAAGFDVRDGVVRLGSTALRLTGTGARFEGWALDGVEHSVDGLTLVDPVGSGTDTSATAGWAHPNGIVRIDHVVVRSGDVDRTVGAFESAGLEVRGGRSTTSYGSPMRQVFLWAGDVIVELIGPDRDEPTTDEPTSIFGLALVAHDLDVTAAFLGDLMSAAKDAVQPGRRIAGLRGSKVGVHLPIAVMSPHV